MFENLQEKLELALKKFRGQSVISEDNIADALNEIRKALIEADVNFSVAKKFVEEVKQKALGREVRGKLLPEQLIVKIVHDELVEIMGKKMSDISFSAQPPTIIMKG